MGLVMFDYDGVIVDSYRKDYVDFVQVCRTHGLEINSKEEYDRLPLYNKFFSRILAHS